MPPGKAKASSAGSVDRLKAVSPACSAERRKAPENQLPEKVIPGEALPEKVIPEEALPEEVIPEEVPGEVIPEEAPEEVTGEEDKLSQKGGTDLSPFFIFLTEV